MKNTITKKLFLIQLLTSLVLVGGMYLFVQWSFDRGFIRYVEQREKQLVDGLVSELSAIHSTDKGWQTLADSPDRWLQLITSAVGRNLRAPRLAVIAREIRNSGWPPKHRPQPPEGLPQALEWRTRLLDAQRSMIYGPADEPLSKLELSPIKNEQGETVGYLGMRKDEAAFSVGHDLQFAEQQNQAYLVIALIMSLISAGVAMPLARHFVEPIRELTQATRRLASGDYAPRIQHQSDDELGQLAQDFNELALTLSKNETLRRQWVADISHELRTPLCVLLGEIHAIREGVYPRDDNTMNSLHQEARHLSRLVDDLYELSMSDIGALDYHKVPLDLGAATQDVLEGWDAAFSEKEISITAPGVGDVQAIVHADPDRIAQLLSNLLHNTLRYTDPKGFARVTLTATGGIARLLVEDSAPGVADQELPKLFERLYRSDASRNRKTGGTGLGLAICNNIVDAHEGYLTASPSELGGLKITLELPLIAGDRA